MDAALGRVTFPESLALRQEICVASPVTAFIFAATTTAQLADLPWSTVVAVMLAVPVLRALTTPSAETLATASLSLVHVTSLLVALSGVTVASRVNSSPTVNSNALLEREMELTRISSGPF